MSPLNESPYSTHFRMLTKLGVWLLDSNDHRKITLFVMYRLLVTVSLLYAAYGLLLDFYLVFGNFKKMTWNLCITLFFVGSLSKTFHLMQKTYELNRLRRQLHRDEQSRHTPDDLVIHEIALKELKFLRMTFYSAAVVFIPVWLVSMYFSYLWGPRELPIPIRLPIEIDINNSNEYNYAFVLLSLGGLCGIMLITEQEMAMFSIFIQIGREYRMLLKDIPKLNEMYESPMLMKKYSVNMEFNPWLRKEKTKLLVKEFSRRQQKLIQYTKEFEFCYNKSLLLQVFGVSLLVTVNALQLLLESVDLNLNIIYQMGYLGVTLTDLFLTCWFGTRLSSQCTQVGEAAYDTVWYSMSLDIQKDIGMIIMRSQHPPRITCGKLMELNLNIFMHRMSNIYSWLALFRQLEMKFNN